MLCPSVFQPSSASTRPFLDVHWPIRSLFPDTRPLFFHMEREMWRHLWDMKHTVEHLERLHQRIFDEIDRRSPSSGVFRPIAFREVGTEDGHFAVSLDIAEFSPEDLSVKQVGRKLRVSGRTEDKQEDGRGSYSYRCQEFRQDFDLPDDVNPEVVTCSLVGRLLQIQAPRDRAASGTKERVVPIKVTPAPAIKASGEGAESGRSSTCEGAESDATAASENSTVTTN